MIIRCFQCAAAIRHHHQTDDFLYNKTGRVVGEFLYTNNKRQRLYIHTKRCLNDYNEGEPRHAQKK